jgi:hypothetical protein
VPQGHSFDIGGGSATGDALVYETENIKETSLYDIICYNRLTDIFKS